ncbi:hypothetical protein BSKO_02325 [Bryopsis sp. KO-2023]|nr:hypothetical protein BSKO_02325 [Bryopsis sp. KO-2023]
MLSAILSLLVLGAVSAPAHEQSAIIDPRVYHHHNSKSLIRPQAVTFSFSEDVEVSLDARVLHKSGQSFEISVCCVSDPKDDDWMAVYAPADVDPTAVAPVKFFLAKTMQGYLETGRGVSRVKLFNHRTNSMRVALMRGGHSSPVMVAQSPTIKIANVNEPLHGHLAITGKQGEMLIQWTTKDRGSPRAMWGAESNEYTHSVEGGTVTYSKEDLCGAPATEEGWMEPGVFHRALMTDLKPGKTYYYKYGDEEFGFSEEFSFVTPPEAGAQDSITFIAFGDMGEKEDPYCTGSINTINRLETELDAQLIIHNGDVGYSMGYVSTWDLFMEGIQKVATRIPYMTSVGNHERDWPGTGDRYQGLSDDSRGECGVPYKQRFKMPTPEGKHVYWYSFDFGPVHFLVFDTEDAFSPGSAQYKFIEQDLGKVDRSKTPWVIAIGHRPVYISSEDPRPIEGDNAVAKDLRESLEPVFYKHQVSVVLQGHNHSYQRTCSVFKEKCRSTGRAPIYVDIGNAGARLIDPPPEHPEHIEMAVAEYGFSRFSVNGTDLFMESVRSSDGSNIDTIHLQAGTGTFFPKAFRAESRKITK